MPLDLFFDIGQLFAAVVAAFAISAVVGMLLAGLWARSHSFPDASQEPGPPRWQPDPADDRTATVDLTPSGTVRRRSKVLEKAS
jgi:hypothetical protein